MNNEIVFLPIRDLGKIIKKKEISPVEVTKLFLSRLEEIGPEYNSVVTVTRDLALSQAQNAEKEILSGNYKGALHGIPYGAKDLLSTSGGIPTTWGAEPFRDRTFDYDATVITKLHEAGAILAAKLAMVELAGGMGYTQPNASLTGPCKNPWGKESWAGGSSSGPGSAVGCGLIPFAIGSETWGSILSPANNCGISGLRPTYGRVSRHGAMALSWTLDKLGPLALTADDCGLVLDVISGSDPNDPSAAEMDYSYSLGSLQRRPRLGILKGALSEVDKEISDNFQASFAILNNFADTEEFTFPEYPYKEVTRTIMLGESASAFEEITKKGLAAELTAPEDRYGPYARTMVLAKDYIKALRIRGAIAPKIDTVMSKYDAIIGPTRQTTASSLDEEFPRVTRDNAKDELGAIGNVLGLPAISIPNGFTEENLPTGIQFLGRPYEENRIMTLANKYQSLTDWHNRHPESLLEKKNLSGESSAL
jgi:aspartyl-tRNA(Asn)/glutamyl-tRNA(Gln) amidotransferase subunit A